MLKGQEISILLDTQVQNLHRNYMCEGSPNQLKNKKYYKKTRKETKTVRCTLQHINTDQNETPKDMSSKTVMRPP